MNDSIIKILMNISAADFISFIIACITILTTVNAIIIKMFNKLEHWRQRKNRQEKTTEIIEGISEIKEKLSLVCKSLQTVLADNLNRKCRYYSQIQYIPEDELDEFINEYKAYNNLKGDTSLSMKVNKIINSLQVKNDIDKETI